MTSNYIVDKCTSTDCSRKNVKILLICRILFYSLTFPSGACAIQNLTPRSSMKFSLKQISNFILAKFPSMRCSTKTKYNC